MDKVKRWLDILYDEKISRDFDRIVILLGDEGMGKSTLSNCISMLWKEVKGEGRAWEYAHENPDAILETVAWEANDFKTAMAERPPESVIQVPDAARVLHKKKAMHGEQIELETDLLDVRTKGFLILLGYQDWDDVPKPLQNRRAKNVLKIPKRGSLRGYNRESMDERQDTGKWPEADLTDTFPNLEGTPLWERFYKADLRMKEQRIAPDSTNDDEDELSENERLKAIANEIQQNDFKKYIREHNGNGTLYVAGGLIELEYDLSQRQAKKVKLLLESNDLTEAVSSDTAPAT